MRVCIDNHVLVWGIRKKATPGQEHMIPRTEVLIDYLTEKKYEVIVPAPVVTEFLMGTPIEQHDEVLRTLTSRFMVVPYDLPASVHAARIWQQHKGRQDVLNGPLIDGVSSWRTKLKVDCQILGIAIHNKVDLVYSHDEALLAMARGIVPAQMIPEMSFQAAFDL